jgi:hypothetical protein
MERFWVRKGKIRHRFFTEAGVTERVPEGFYHDVALRLMRI